MATIFALSSQSQVPNPTSVSTELVAIAGHLITYGILLLLIWYAIGASRRLASTLRLLLAFVLTVVYGISDEVHQSFVPGRTATTYDVLTDAAGAVIMIALIMYCSRSFYRELRQ